jgi:hypothetical protein
MIHRLALEVLVLRLQFLDVLQLMLEAVEAVVVLGVIMLVEQGEVELVEKIHLP